MITFAMIAGGLVGLVVGGDLLVRGASKLALAAKVSPLVIGLTVVALGTSAPELGVSVQSCFAGATELAIGNAVGSNISNILLVLGSTAAVSAVVVNTRLFRLDIPVMIAAAIALWVLGADGNLNRIEGGVLVLAMIGYLWWTVQVGRKEQRKLDAEIDELLDDAPAGAAGLTLAVGQVVVGLVLLVGGANFLVEGCVQLAEAWGISQMVIGLTVTAIGTSLPELFTSIVAAWRGKQDLAVGNVVGSNILNVLAVLGISSTVAPAGIPVSPDALSLHIPIMVAVSVCCLPIFLTGAVIVRWEGLLMLTYYLVFLAFISLVPSEGGAGYAVITTLLLAAPLGLLTIATLLAPRPKR
ncbi:MAG: calcium/sodium antiporter [Planctomycetota bacterium]